MRMIDDRTGLEVLSTPSAALLWSPAADRSPSPSWLEAKGPTRSAANRAVWPCQEPARHRTLAPMTQPTRRARR